MPRRPRILEAGSWSHVTVRSNNREEFDLALRDVWCMFERHLFLVTRAFDARIGAMVLMPNHLHLLIRNQEANLDSAMNYLLREVSKDIGRESRRINHVFGNRYFSSVIRDHRHLHAVYKYIYRNPVLAGLSESVETYAFSTIPIFLGRARFAALFEDPLDFPESAEQILSWLNEGYESSVTERIRRGLRFREFRLSSIASSRKRPDECLEFRPNAQRFTREDGNFVLKSPTEDRIFSL